MTVVTDRAAPQVELGLFATLLVAGVAGAGLVLAAQHSVVLLLIVVAVVQGLLALAWVNGTNLPGHRGALVVGALAAGGADVAVSLFPHGRLGALLIVLGLAVPVMFVHQLVRGAARVQVVASLSAVAVLVLAEVALPALLQLMHESVTVENGGDVVGACVAAIAGALVVGCLVDLLAPVPRFDADVPRGLLGLVASTAIGAALGYLLLETEHGFGGASGAFVGGALGAVAGLLAVAMSFVLYTTQVRGRARTILRPVFAGLLPLCLLAPGAYLLCLAVRS